MIGPIITIVAIALAAVGGAKYGKTVQAKAIALFLGAQTGTNVSYAAVVADIKADVSKATAAIKKYL